MVKRGVVVQESLFDLKAYNEYVNSNPVNALTDRERCWMPIGTNVAVELFRKVAQTPAARQGHSTVDTVGHTVVMDYYTFGVKVYVKVELQGKQRRLVVFLEDSDGREVIGEYEQP